MGRASLLLGWARLLNWRAVFVGLASLGGWRSPLLKRLGSCSANAGRASRSYDWGSLAQLSSKACNDACAQSHIHAGGAVKLVFWATHGFVLRCKRRAP